MVQLGTTAIWCRVSAFRYALGAKSTASAVRRLIPGVIRPEAVAVGTVTGMHTKVTRNDGTSIRPTMLHQKAIRVIVGKYITPIF